MKAIKEAIEKAREKVNNVEFKKMLKEKLGKELDIADTSEYFMFNDWDELFHLLSLVAKKQRDVCGDRAALSMLVQDQNVLTNIFHAPLITDKLKES